ncbi:hypothetical protein [Fredinandcohnia quinoae]|uniref:Uncharacterized protein n=1 Tax=Fredinandcohnia quinoae TaxID=2918902 RepID=A0AAW5DX15_9BACI|nr:hypothetical protein [Fredinandcohnia sp. SECRCQ15]MCH1624583.1 hypothetical protein [Fredinandcohnia sp. SECRCQ15]
MTGLNAFLLLFLIFIFIAVLILSGRFFYFLELKSFTKRISKKLGLDILQLNFSFEQMTYFLALPSNLPFVKNVNKEDIVIELDYTSLLFPKLVGIKILIKSDMVNEIIAYLPIKHFRLSTLDRLLEQDKIDESDYLKISTYTLVHSTTLREIKDEVYKQLKSK